VDYLRHRPLTIDSEIGKCTVCTRVKSLAGHPGAQVLQGKGGSRIGDLAETEAIIFGFA
jgi:hypothetical protein